MKNKKVIIGILLATVVIVGGIFLIEYRKISEPELLFTISEGSSEEKKVVEVQENKIVFDINVVGYGGCDNEVKMEKKGSIIKLFFVQNNCKVRTGYYNVKGEIINLDSGTYTFEFYVGKNKIFERKLTIE